MYFYYDFHTFEVLCYKDQNMCFCFVLQCSKNFPFNTREKLVYSCFAHVGHDSDTFNAASKSIHIYA